MKKIVRLTESDLHRIVKRCVNEAFRDIDNPNDYVSQNNLSWRPASKFQRVNAQSGKAYMNQYARDNRLSKRDRRALGRKGAPLETIASDGTRETNNHVGLNQTVLNNIGNRDNRWAVDNKTFNRKYEQDPSQDGIYKPKGGPMNATQINEPISFNAPWGERMNIDKGGYLLQDPHNVNDVYGISQKDFDNTYKFDESVHRAVVKALNEARAPKYWQPDEFVNWDEWIGSSNYGYDFFEKNMEKSDKLGIPLDQRCHLCNKALKGDKYKPVKFSTASGSSHWCYNPNSKGEDVKIGNTCFKSLQRAHDRKYGK